jgi:hypothetical protein
MASRGCALRELEQVQVLTEILGDENIGEFSFRGNCIYECDDMQLVTQGTHVISDSDEVIVVVMNNMKTTKDWEGC